MPKQLITDQRLSPTPPKPRKFRGREALAFAYTPEIPSD